MLILFTSGCSSLGRLLRYLNVQCTSVGTGQEHCTGHAMLLESIHDTISANIRTPEHLEDEPLHERFGVDADMISHVVPFRSSHFIFHHCTSANGTKRHVCCDRALQRGP